jgi:hypothetical protein
MCEGTHSDKSASDVEKATQKEPQTPQEAAAGMYEAARALLDKLFVMHKDANRFPPYALFPFHSLNRFDWYFLPASLITRSGLPLRSMNPGQQQLALELLKRSLSAGGYQKTEYIRQLEFVLHEIERTQPNPFRRDAEAFHFTIFGNPSADGTWGWRYEGHHSSLQWTIVNGEVISTTPQFLGASPAEVTIDVHGGPPVGTRVLAEQEDLARALVGSFNEQQQREAILVGPVPQEILTMNQRRASIQEERGVSYASLDNKQRELLRQLVESYASVQLAPIARERMTKIERAGWDNVKYAWTGSLDKGQLQYYRIVQIVQSGGVTSGGFLIEYDTPMREPQHRHTVWRDFVGDWGEDRLPAPRLGGNIMADADLDSVWGPDPLMRHYLTADHHALDREEHGHTHETDLE